jgi:hypothetical protein
MESGHTFGHIGPCASRFIDPIGRDRDEASARRGQGDAHRGQGEGGLKREQHVGPRVGFDLRNGAGRGKVSAVCRAAGASDAAAAMRVGDEVLGVSGARERGGGAVEDWETFRR